MSFFKFFNVGVLQLIIDTILLKIFIVLGVEIIYANYMSRGFTALIGCYLNYKVTFRSNDNLIFVYAKLVIFWLFMTFLSSNLISILYESSIFKSANIIGVKILSEGILFIISYFISKGVVFKNGKKSSRNNTLL